MHMQSITRTDPAPATSQGLLRNNISRLGAVEVIGAGVWSVDYVDAHFAALERDLLALRAKVGRARVLVDLSAAAVQPPATADRIAYWTGRIYRAEDRVAIVHDSRFLKAQMQERVMIAVFDVFTSEVAARLWLYGD